MRVVPVREDGAAPPHQLVQADGHPTRERLHPTRERGRVVRLHDEMDVVAQDGEVYDLEILARQHPAQRSGDDAVAALAPEIPDVLTHPERHMHRTPTVDPDSDGVGDLRTLSDRLSSGAAAPPTPCRLGRKLQREL
jgi:hypothetical protein